MTITQFYSVLSQPNLVLTPQEHADLKSMIDQFPAFQLAKMLELKTLQLQDSTLFRNKLSKVAAQMPNREALFTLLYQQKPTKTKVEAPKVIEKPETISQEIKLEAPSKKEIIDQFIRTSPAIRRPETKVATDETPLVDHSIDEKYDLVSETLAELYLQQGAKEKAVKVYQKLILIYPEKISFFAARIFEIQNNQ